MRALLVAAVEHRFGRVNRLPLTIEWLSDNGSCYLASDTRSFARVIGLELRTTPIESPQSNGMAEAFVRTIKRDYVRASARSDAQTVLKKLPSWITHYNEVHPPRLSDIVHLANSSQLAEIPGSLSGHSGATTRWRLELQFGSEPRYHGSQRWLKSCHASVKLWVNYGVVHDERSSPINYLQQIRRYRRRDNASASLCHFSGRGGFYSGNDQERATAG